MSNLIMRCRICNSRRVTSRVLYRCQRRGNVTRVRCKKCGRQVPCYERKDFPDKKMLKAFALYFMLLRADEVEKQLGVCSETLRRNLIRYILPEHLGQRVLNALKRQFRIPEERLLSISDALERTLPKRLRLRTLTFANQRLLRSNLAERRAVERKVSFILQQKVRVSPSGKIQD